MADAEIAQFKICTKCGVSKPRAAFAKAAAGLRGDCKECRKQYNRKWFANLSQSRRKERINPASKAAYYEKNKELFRRLGMAWVEDNRDLVRERQRATMRRWRVTPKHRLEHNISRSVNLSLRGGKGGASCFKLLGFTVEQLVRHLELQFSPGMSWDNYGEWHVDHRVPLASFRYETSNDDEFRQAWALTNLQPLWAKQNISKGARRLLLI